MFTLWPKAQSLSEHRASNKLKEQAVKRTTSLPLKVPDFPPPGYLCIFEESFEPNSSRPDYTGLCFGGGRLGQKALTKGYED